MQRARNITYCLAAATALATFLVYLPALRNDFVNWDDYSYILKNLHIRSFDDVFLKWAFLNFYCSNWHPLTWISHAADYAVWGLNPLGHHLTNNMLHAANSFLVVILITKTLEAAKKSMPESGGFLVFKERVMLLTAGVTGLLFGIHPLHVESVAWVAERKDLLCALFFLMSILSYMKFVGSWQPAVGGLEPGVESQKSSVKRQLSTGFYLFSLVFFVLALVSKPMGVTLPIVLMILDWHPFNRISSYQTLRKAVVEKLPFLALSLVSSVLTILAQGSGGALTPIEVVPLSIRLLVAMNALSSYLWKMMLPWDLVPFYPYPREATLLSSGYLVPAVLVFGITIVCALIVKKQRVFLAVWGYYVITLLPVLGIIQVGEQAMADRYTYLPSLGPFFVLGLTTAVVAAKVSTIKRWGLTAKTICAAMAIAALASLSYLTVTQIGVWKESFKLWNYIIEKQPAAKRAYYNRGLTFNNRGLVFYNMGQFDRALAEYDRALADYGRATELNPPYVEVYNNRGLVFDKMGLPDRAIAEYDKSTALDPSYYRAYYNRGMVFKKMGLLEKALEEYNRAIVLNPEYSDAYNNRGALFYIMNQFDRAIADYDRAITLNPSNYEAYYNRGLAFDKTGQFAKAAADLEAANKLSSHH